MMLESAEPPKLNEATELVEKSDCEASSLSLVENCPVEQIQTVPEQQEPEKIDEVFLQYWKRIFAFVIDYFVCGLSSLGAGFFLPILMLGFDILWTGYDCSPGKRYFSLRVTAIDGKKISENRAFARTLLKWTTLSIVFLGFAQTHSALWFLLLVTYKRKTIYDWLAGTCVMGKEVDMRTAFSPRPNYFLFLALVTVVLSFSYLRFSLGHRLLSIVEPLLPGLLQPAHQALAIIEMSIIHLDPARTVDFSRIDRLAELQQVVAPSGTLSKERLDTLMVGYDAACQKRNRELAAKYAKEVLAYGQHEIRKASLKTRPLRSYHQDSTVVRLYADAGKVKEGAALLEEMSSDTSSQIVRDRLNNDLINYLYRGVQWRADAVRLRAKVINGFTNVEYKNYWNYCQGTIKQQVYDLHALSRDKEANELDTYIEQLEKKLRAEHEREKMRLL